jgi:hypothetical protein
MPTRPPPDFTARKKQILDCLADLQNRRALKLAIDLARESVDCQHFQSRPVATVAVSIAGEMAELEENYEQKRIEFLVYKQYRDPALDKLFLLLDHMEEEWAR